MREIELETLRFRKHGSTHFVARVDEQWTGSEGFAYTFCGRSAGTERIEPRKFSTVRDWCLPCYWNRHKALDRKFGVVTR